jgi:hypothetical protein
MRKIILLITAMIASAINSHSQGCVAIRTIGGVRPNLLFRDIENDDKFIISITSRYFKASKSFKGDAFFSDTLVTNKIYTMNIFMLVLLKNGWSAGVSIPILANSRNNGADHKGPTSYPKYTTQSFGLGDIRFAVYKWLLDPANNRKGNIQVGLGLKLPTGDFKYQDYFIRNDSTKILAPVDQSIQLGDGGTGITAEVSAYYSLFRKLNLYAQLFYLANPRDQNGVSNLKGRSATAQQIANNTTVMSVPDQYSIRGGATFELEKLNFDAGVRYERVPAKDVIGMNKGFRRVASIASMESGFTYKMKNAFAFFTLGIPFKRNIVLNTQNDMTPAGFADWILSFGLQFKL